MSEAETIQSIESPRSRETLAADLRLLGLTAGMTVIVHSSLSSIGWVSGGSVAVVQALLDVITPDGTLVMPAHSGDLSDPSYWRHPPVPETWWQSIRDTMPAFDPRFTPTRGMGRIAETFRTWPDAIRSLHPQDSFAAWGRHAEFITVQHTLDFGLGDQSPLARVYDLDGYVLLLGVPHGNNTSFHLGEYRAPGGKIELQGAPIYENGERVWKTFTTFEVDADCFDELGADFEKVHPVKIGRVGSATTRLFSQRAAVDFAQEWIAWKRSDSTAKNAKVAEI
ncbi:SPbeta prophage-derived aminoglycoside N(3')-acetyltransferase-like protein YokD [Thermoflexales bacterium]|nr:SPbeta prophage-derived aminoglycoside N(3')-acetyltransferase-like protein YokD [Thermoflexales bacterium]